MKINELDSVSLKRDIMLDNSMLSAGTVGTVVYKHSPANAFEVEFVNASGATVSVMTLKASDIKPLKKNDLLYAR